MSDQFIPEEGTELTMLQGWVAVEQVVEESHKVQRALKTVLAAFPDSPERDEALSGWRFLAEAGDETSIHILRTLEDMKEEEDD